MLVNVNDTDRRWSLEAWLCVLVYLIKFYILSLVWFCKTWGAFWRFFLLVWFLWQCAIMHVS